MAERTRVEWVDEDQSYRQNPPLLPNASQLPPEPRQPPVDRAQLERTIARGLNDLWWIGLYILISLVVLIGVVS